ncbi:MAG: hypothetical protein EOM26_13740, partial [Alphaproteobacteria bacterium]|nr:hypothetical protein [Alphaproteobacteria bacterium]
MEHSSCLKAFARRAIRKEERNAARPKGKDAGAMPKKGGPLQTEFNFRSLMVKEENGRYRMATAEEILEAAR